jgi:hypothetical protein
VGVYLNTGSRKTNIVVVYLTAQAAETVIFLGYVSQHGKQKL